MVKEKIKDIYIDDDIYPRINKSNKTIEAYIESLKAGAKFPPIEVQKINNEGTEQIILLDGLHRLEAYKESKIDEIDVIFWKEDILNKKEYLNDLRLRAANLNIQHGDRLSHEDMKQTSRKIATDDPEKKYTEQKIADQLGIPQQTVHDWIADIRANQTASRNNIIYRLAFLGWTQDEIAEKTGLTSRTIREIGSNTEIGKISAFINDQLKKGNTIEQAAGKLEIDHTLAWTIHLKDKTDDKRLEELKIEPKKFTSWNFTGCNPLMGRDTFNGRIPGEFPLNFIYRFTKPGDLVIDPMAGGGITLDACLLLNRKCRSYDIEPIRDEIEKHDITKGYPELKKKPNAIFCDPPYWSCIDYNEGLSSYSLIEYYDAISKFIKDTYDVLQNDGIFGIMMSNQSTRIPIEKGKLTQEYGHRLEHIITVYNMCLDVKFKPEWRIICPLSNQNAQDWARGEWELGRLGELNRELLIFRK